LIYKLLYI